MVTWGTTVGGKKTLQGLIILFIFFLRLFSSLFGVVGSYTELQMCSAASYTPGPSIEYLSELQCEKINV